MAEDRLAEISNMKRRFASVQESADLVQGVRKQLNVTIPTIGVIKTTINKPRARKTKQTTAPALGVVTHTTDDTLDMKIKNAEDMAKAAHELSEHYIQKNLAESSVAGDIASQNAPVTDAINKLQDKVTALSNEQAKDRAVRRSTKDSVSEANHRALIEATAAIKDEVASSSNLSVANKDDLLIKLASIEGKLNTGNELSAVMTDSIIKQLEHIEAQSQAQSQVKPEESDDRLAQFAKNFDLIDAIVDDPDNEHVKADIGVELWGALRTAVSNYMAGNPNEADRKALEQAMPKLQKLAELSPSIAEALSGVVDVKEEQLEDVETNDIGQLLTRSLDGREKAPATISLSKKNVMKMNGVDLKYDPNNLTIKIKDDVIVLTPGLTHLLMTTVESANLNKLKELAKAGRITRRDIKTFVEVYNFANGDNDNNKVKKILGIEALLANKEATHEEKPYSVTPKKKAKTELQSSAPTEPQASSSAPAEPDVKGTGIQPIAYTVDSDAYQKGRVKLFGPPKVRGGKPVRPKALIDLPLSEDLELLLSTKKISPNRKFDPQAIEHFKTVHSYLGGAMKIGKQGTRYALLHGTKMPKDKSIIVRTPKSTEGLKNKLTTNLGIIAAGNSNEQLKLETLIILKQLSDAGLLEKKYLQDTLPLLR